MNMSNYYVVFKTIGEFESYYSEIVAAEELTTTVIADWTAEIKKNLPGENPIITNIIKLDDPPKWQRLQDKGDNL